MDLPGRAGKVHHRRVIEHTAGEIEHLDIARNHFPEPVGFRKTRHPAGVHELVGKIAEMDVFHRGDPRIQRIVPDILVAELPGCSDAMQGARLPFVIAA